jgi:tRNA(Ile)-lysidine synthase
VALSGGGDSVALLLAARAWAQAHDRPLVALTVDHRLRPEGAAWSAVCAARAAALGIAFRALTWEGTKPATGLPAAARSARHRLMADAAREAGARVILVGHTADDLLEAEAMRAAGSTTPSPREWSPSPVWPQGRELFLLRPMLGLRRADLRAWLRAQGEPWIEDPANDDQTFARARARLGLVGRAKALRIVADSSPAANLAAATRSDATGVLAVPRDRLRRAALDVLARFVSAACLCAAGGERSPGGAQVRRLAGRLTGPATFVATLAGARIEASEDHVHLLREPGEAGRGGLAPLSLRAGRSVVWDGRFEIRADRAITVRPLAGLTRSLAPQARAALAATRAGARPGLPVVIDAEGTITCPTLEPVAGIAVRPLALERLQAACGLVTREP